MVLQTDVSSSRGVDFQKANHTKIREIVLDRNQRDVPRATKARPVQEHRPGAVVVTDSGCRGRVLVDETDETTGSGAPGADG